MKKLTVQLRWSPREAVVVGQLAESDRRMYFEYDRSFLERGWLLSPFKLPLRPGLIEHVDLEFSPLPGVFDDSLPDAWGLLLMDRVFRRRGLDPAAVTPLERLTYLGTRTMGALTYHPPAEAERSARLLDIRQLARNAQQILKGEAAEVLPELMRAGGSAGGARPKVLVGVSGDEIISGEDDLPEGYEHWIIKFPAKADAKDAGPIEAAYASMARAAGIDMPETRLFHVPGRSRGQKASRYFGVHRFDRAAGNRRLHVHTFGNLIHANFRVPSTDYATLLKVTSALTRNQQDVLRAFRRMVFNIVAHNRDDHAKNFAFVMNNEGEWSLSPAYDLTFSSGPGGEHTMTVDGEGLSPGKEHVLRLAKQFAIRKREADQIIDAVHEAADKWRHFADAAGCSQKVTSEIEAGFQSLRA